MTHMAADFVSFIWRIWTWSRGFIDIVSLSVLYPMLISVYTIRLERWIYGVRRQHDG